MLQYSPKIVTDSLVMCLDASNNKSYPTDLPVKNGLALWLDAADDSTFSYSSGTSISQWRDKSGNNRHFFQATAGNQPSRSAVVNSRKAIQFTAASSQYLRYNSTVINNTTGGSVFVVWRTAGETNAYSSILDNYHCGNNALGAGFQIERNGDNNQYYWGFVTTGCANAGFMPATSYSNDTTNCIWITKDSTTITGGLNGTSGTPNASPSSTWVEDDKGWTIGAWGSGTESFARFFNGIECEVIIFNRGLSPIEVKKVNTYLGQKWGISNTDRSIVDLSTNNYSGLLGNGTVANMPLFDVYNKGALKFDGSTDYISTGVSSIVPTSTAAYTVSVWCYRNTNNTGYKELLAQWTSANSGNSFFFGFDNSAVRFTDNWNPITVSGAGNTNVWMNLVGVYTVSNAYIYLNGVLAATKGSGFTYTGTGPLIIGRQGELASEYFDGNIGNVLIYNKALSAAEVLQNYEAQKSKFANTIVQQGLVLNLDVGNPYSYGGAGTTVYDVSNTALSWTTNNTTYNSDPIKYFSYNGSNCWLESSTSAAYDSQTITMECWCYPNTLAQSGFLFEKGAVNTQYSMFFNGDGVFYFRTKSISTEDLSFTSSSHLTSSAWNHIVCTYGAGTKTVYVNGTQKSQQTGLTGTLPTGQTNQYIGKYGAAGNNFPFNGRIAESRVYNIALSAAQVLQNYNATKGRFGL